MNDFELCQRIHDLCSVSSHDGESFALVSALMADNMIRLESQEPINPFERSKRGLMLASHVEALQLLTRNGRKDLVDAANFAVEIVTRPRT